MHGITEIGIGDLDPSCDNHQFAIFQSAEGDLRILLAIKDHFYALFLVCHVPKWHLPRGVYFIVRSKCSICAVLLSLSLYNSLELYMC